MKKNLSLFACVVFAFNFLLVSPALSTEATPRLGLRKNIKHHGLRALSGMYAWGFGLPTSLLIRAPYMSGSSFGKSIQSSSFKFFVTSVCSWGVLWALYKKINAYRAYRIKEEKDLLKIRRAVRNISIMEENLKKRAASARRSSAQNGTRDK